MALRKSFWQRSEQLSPRLIRLLARHPHGRPLTDDEIGSRMFPEQAQHGAGVVRVIEACSSWDSVSLSLMRRYLRACNCDFCDVADMKRIDSYMRSRPNFKYLRHSRDWRTKFEPLFRAWRKEVSPV